jgi:hypothetical protein
MAVKHFKSIKMDHGTMQCFRLYLAIWGIYDSAIAKIQSFKIRTLFFGKNTLAMKILQNSKHVC